MQDVPAELAAADETGNAKDRNVAHNATRITLAANMKPHYRFLNSFTVSCTYTAQAYRAIIASSDQPAAAPIRISAT